MMVTLRVLYRATQKNRGVPYCTSTRSGLTDSTTPTDMKALLGKTYAHRECDVTWPSNHVFKSGKCTTVLKCVVPNHPDFVMSYLITATDCPDAAAPSTSGASRVWLSLATASTAGMAFLL